MLKYLRIFENAMLDFCAEYITFLTQALSWQIPSHYSKCNSDVHPPQEALDSSFAFFFSHLFSISGWNASALMPCTRIFNRELVTLCVIT